MEKNYQLQHCHSDVTDSVTGHSGKERRTSSANPWREEGKTQREHGKKRPDSKGRGGWRVAERSTPVLHGGATVAWRRRRRQPAETETETRRGVSPGQRDGATRLDRQRLFTPAWVASRTRDPGKPCRTGADPVAVVRREDPPIGAETLQETRDFIDSWVLRDQLLLGLREGSLSQALKIYARRNPDETFAELRKEALLLDAEHGNAHPEDTSWKETLKKEIMEDVKLQMTGFTQELLKEIKPLLQPSNTSTQPPTQSRRERRQPASQINHWDEQGVQIEGVELSGLLDTGSQVTLMQQSLFEQHFTQAKLGKTPLVFQLRAANGLEIPYTSYAVLDMVIEGVEVPERGVVIVKDEHCTQPLLIGMNVVTACWNVLFKWSDKSAFSPKKLQSQQIWKGAFAKCRHIEATAAEDGLLGYVRPASRRVIKVPARSEMLVWGRARMGPGGADYCALVEALPGTSDVGVARTLAVVRNGRVPVRVCNPHSYCLTLGRYQKLGKLYHVDEADMHGPRDLNLSLGDGDVVEVALVDLAADQENQELPKEVSELTNRTDLSEKQLEELRTLLLKWKKVFALHDEDFGRTDLVHHRIHTGDAPPVRERYRPLPPAMYKEMKSLLAGMLEKGVIRESCSPWAAPIVLVRKKDGSWRFCVDYRKLNAVTHKDAFPLPRIEETLTSLTRAEWFSTLDLASGYWQVEMDPQDREKTAFTTPLGLFEFERMPFGLCNAPATFQRLMQQCLNGQLSESVLVYLDDIIIYSPDFSSHLQHLDEVFHRLWRHGLKLRLDKCKLLQPEVKFLGHVVDQKGVKPDPDKISAVLDCPIPTTIKQVRAFLGLAGYYRRFVSGFAKIARPLNQLLTGIPADKKFENRKVQWSPECQMSFDELKTALTQAPVLAYADYSLPFIVYTDASNQGLGAVLAQVQEGKERVIAYASRSLHPTERNDANYSSFKLELLALKWAVTEKFKDYLTGAQFTVYTDNNPVAHLQTARLGAVEQRWVAQLAFFDYNIKYRSGKSNVNADALSRFPANPLPTDVSGPGPEMEAAAVTAAIELTPEGGEEEWVGSEWEEAQTGDQDIQAVKRLCAPALGDKMSGRVSMKRLPMQEWREPYPGSGSSSTGLVWRGRITCTCSRRDGQRDRPLREGEEDSLGQSVARGGQNTAGAREEEARQQRERRLARGRKKHTCPARRSDGSVAATEETTSRDRD
ncbi:uncharacterized protein LOC115368614 [Myripristis murdjan]|uniref:uncharacterized protein LOC115368614 n=1 Tax=Myripristis murdjan TaxID=586833 RepID=UPI0011764320|nr:uncharacterized protein LOC115368614 [Myripristis murdjan]